MDQWIICIWIAIHHRSALLPLILIQNFYFALDDHEGQRRTLWTLWRSGEQLQLLSVNRVHARLITTVTANAFFHSAVPLERIFHSRVALNTKNDVKQIKRTQQWFLLQWFPFKFVAETSLTVTSVWRRFARFATINRRRAGFIQLPGWSMLCRIARRWQKSRAFCNEEIRSQFWAADEFTSLGRSRGFWLWILNVQKPWRNLFHAWATRSVFCSSANDERAELNYEDQRNLHRTQTFSAREPHKESLGKSLHELSTKTKVHLTFDCRSCFSSVAEVRRQKLSQLSSCEGLNWSAK